MSGFIIHSVPGSPFGRAGLATLEEKHAPYRFALVPPGGSKAPEHLARHPFGKVPAFEHDGFMLYETQAILRYIDEGFMTSPLQPTDLHQFSRMNQIIGIVDAYAHPSIGMRILFNRMLAPRLGMAADESAVEAALPQA